jgi:hypothetical protein
MHTIPDLRARERPSMEIEITEVEPVKATAWMDPGI